MEQMPLKGAIDTERAKSILRESFGGLRLPGTQFTCFTSTKGQILTPAKSILRESFERLRLQGTQFTCFTGTKGQILTPTRLPGTSGRETARGAAVLEYLTAGGANSKVLSLLALLVQSTKY